MLHFQAAERRAECWLRRCKWAGGAEGARAGKGWSGVTVKRGKRATGRHGWGRRRST